MFSVEIMNSRQLVVDRVETGPGKDSQMDPAFAIPQLNELRLPVGGAGDETLEYLSHNVVRNPRDLRNQVRRIILEYDTGRSDGLYAALVDLFIAMDGRGRSLCNRMLEGSKSVLKPPQFKILADCLKGNLRAKELPAALDCVLGDGLIGKRELIKLAENPPDGAADQGE